MIMVTDTNVGCFDFYAQRREWAAQDEAVIPHASFVDRLLNRIRSAMRIRVPSVAGM